MVQSKSITESNQRLQRKPLRDIHEVEPLTEKDQPMVDEIINILKKYNSIDRFGLTLLHQHFEIADDEILLETTDVKNRVQRISPVKENDKENDKSISTMWRLDYGFAMQVCKCIDINGSHRDHVEVT